MNRNSGLRIGLLAFSLVFVCGMALYLALREARIAATPEFYTLSDAPSDTAGEPSGDLPLESIATESLADPEPADTAGASAVSAGSSVSGVPGPAPSDAGAASGPGGVPPSSPDAPPPADSSDRSHSSPEYADPADPPDEPESSERPASSREEEPHGSSHSGYRPEPSSDPQDPPVPPVSSRPDSSSTDPAIPVSSEPPVSSTPQTSSSPSSAASENPEIVRLQNTEMAEQLQIRYRIVIRLVDSAGAGDAMVAAPESDPFRMRDLLQMTKEALSVFPDTFFNDSLTIVLTGRLNAASGVAGDTAGSSGVVWVASDTGNSSLLLDWLLDFSASCFVRQHPMDFTEYNPASFYYGAAEGRYVYSAHNPYGGYFLSTDAQMSPAADQKALWRALLTQPSLLEQIPGDCAMRAKVTALCEAAVSWRPCLSVHRTVRRYLFS